MSEERRDYRSTSELETAQKCGMQHYYAYIEGKKMPPGFAQARGAAAHQVCAMNLRRKRDEEQLFPVEAIRDLTATAFEGELAGGARVTSADLAIGRERARGTEKDNAIRAAVIHAQELAPHITPVMIEAEITTTEPIEEIGSKKLKGIIDLTRKGAEGRRIIVDTKTGTQKRAVREVHVSQQLTVYHALHEIAVGIPPDGVEIHGLITTKTKQYTQVEAGRRTQAEVAAVFRAMGQVEKMIQAGIALPTNPMNWWCSEKWCGYTHICPHYVPTPPEGD